MTATLTPLPAGTDVAETIGGKAHSRSLIMDAAGVDAIGPILARLLTIATSLGAPGDTAWTTGSGSVPALLKALVAAVVALDAGDASAANQATGNTTLASLDTKATARNATLASLLTEVQKTDPAAVTQSGSWSFGLTGTLPAFAATPTFNLGTLNGAATEVTLAALSAKQPTLGQKAAAGSVSFIESSGTTLALASKQDAMQATLDATYAMNTAGYSLTGGTYAAPTGVTIAAGAAGPTTVTLPRSGYYALDVSFTGTSPSLKVQILGVDGTWLDVVTRTVSGAASDPIQFPAGAQIRLFNASAGSLTAVKGRVS